MFDHVTIRVSDRAASESFYDMVLAAVGIARTNSGEWNEFSLAERSEGKPVTQRLHVAFAAASRDQVDAFWRAGTEAGYRDDGKPGDRPEYGPTYYGGFVLDPDGNSVEAVHHDSVRELGGIDHVWMRVADVDASKRFYATVAPFGGFMLRRELPERAQFTAPRGSFSVVAGTPSEGVHLAFTADDNATVDAFHRAVLEAGYRDNGAPGERSIYHAGYYSAFVLDPDGNNVEVVNHNR